MEREVDAKQFVGNATFLDMLIARAPSLLYAKRETVNGVALITCAYRDDPKVHTEHFACEPARDLLWNEFELIMTKMCTPPCIVVWKTLFQPAYLKRLMCYSDSRAHFVILDFGNERSMWFGYLKRESQIDLYNTLLQVLGEPPEPPKNQSVH